MRTRYSMIPLASVLGLLLLAGCTGGGDGDGVGDSGGANEKATEVGKSAPAPTSYSTPVAVFDAAKAAGETEDWKGFCACLTPESLDMFAGGLVMAGSMMEAFAALGGEEGKVAAAAIKDVLSRHGLTDEKLQEAQAKADPTAGPESVAALSAAIQDKAAFIADMLSSMKTASGDAGGKQPGPTIAKDARLVDVQIEGESATATVEVQGKSQPIAFKKIDGGWMIDLTQSMPTAGK